uniref:Multidrug and toxic compound extrusion protein n=1 Tax=Timspurckia oligopyrenoides TaxID=708627 RepID=A0A7S1EQF0_9RHOD|mmetsp:Transcript_12741/g.22905  ORF Transcript_12741/g.22905 Transcript_12741/m.22905 type:complete len:495 (+) Transcript_12741:60-1544(+)
MEESLNISRWRYYYTEHFVALVKLAGPIMLATVSQGCLLLVTMIFSGRMNTDSVAGIALACSILNISCVSLHMGLSTALDTLCSQAYGAGNYKSLGIWLQRSIIIGTFVSLFIGIFWKFCIQSLLLNPLHIDIQVIQPAIIFLNILLTSIWPLMAIECYKRYLQTQSKLIPIVLSSLFGTLLNAFLCYMLLYKFNNYSALAEDSKIQIISWSLSISYWIILVFMIIFSSCTRSNNEFDTWTPITVSNLTSGWIEYLQLGIPSAIHIVLEWSAFEVTLVFASWMNSSIELAAQGILLNFCVFIIMFPLSIGFALSIRVGHLLGSNNGNAVNDTLLIALLTSLSVTLFIAFGIAFVPQLWVRLYVNNTTELYTKISHVSVIFGMYFIADALQNVCMGALKGAGLQFIGAFGSLFGFWCIVLPLSYYLGFHGSIKCNGVCGLWSGFLYGIIPIAAVYLCVLCTRDWNKLAQDIVSTHVTSNASEKSSELILQEEFIA